jgi:hypothetical protein
MHVDIDDLIEATGSVSPSAANLRCRLRALVRHVQRSLKSLRAFTVFKTCANYVWMNRDAMFRATRNLIIHQMLTRQPRLHQLAHAGPATLSALVPRNQHQNPKNEPLQLQPYRFRSLVSWDVCKVMSHGQVMDSSGMIANL